MTQTAAFKPHACHSGHAVGAAAWPAGAGPWGTEALVEAFLVVYQPATRAAYARALREAFAWLRRGGVSPLQASRGDLEGYLAHLRASGLSEGTVAGRLTALAGLYRLAVREHLLATSPMTGLRRPAVHRRSRFGALDAGELRVLLAAAEAHSTRAEALITLLAFTGLRVSAVCGADVQDVVRGGQHWTLRYANKGGGAGTTALAAPVRTALKRYLEGRRSGSLLLSRTGRRLDRVSATRLVQRVGADALPERPDLTCHLLRASFATLALAAGVPVQHVGDALGHADPVTTVLHYDRARRSLEQHPAYTLAALLADPSGPASGGPAASANHRAG